jgi:predicted DCC family thiol-disulfide oxidoreductase YuxK
LSYLAKDIGTAEFTPAWNASECGNVVRAVLSKTCSAMNDSIPESEALPAHLVLYDGSCGFCHGSVKTLVRLDHRHVLRYASLQGKTAAKLRLQYPSIPLELESVVLVSEGRVLLRSQAVFGCAKHFAWPWSAISAFAWLPRGLTDWGYRMVAKYRYRLGGKADVCTIPTPEEKQLYLP